MYRVSMFSHLFVPKVLFFFSILPCQSVPCSQFPSQLFLPVSRNFEVFLFFFFQVDTIPNFFRQPFFIHSSHVAILVQLVCILCHLKPNLQFSLFSNNIISIFYLRITRIFSKKSISMDTSCDSELLLNFHFSAPYVTVLLTIEL